MSIYLDHASFSPLRPSAREAWLAASEVVGNASSVHGAGQDARRLLEESRESLAEALRCEPIEVVFTSGGTEAINLALKGLWWSRATGADAVVLPDGEHHATMDSVAWLVAAESAQVRHVPLDRWGRIDPEVFAAATPGAALATALIANNEVGTIQEAAVLAGAAATAGIPLHLDGVAALGHLPIDFAGWRGDGSGSGGLVALSISGHKIGAPVGTGALVVSRHAALTPVLHGGGQQRGLRSGTPDVAGAAALAVAATEAVAEQAGEHARLEALRTRLITGIRIAVPAAELLGDPGERLPGNVHLHFPGAAGESLLFLLDQAGISVSTGSACQAGVAEPSHVVLALGRTERVARSVLRITLGRTTTAADIDAVLAVLPEAYARASGARTAARS
ncbi:cysteine desulfurase family protein [uncultured Microbacterium sp.]|uniref:cysteine desulfurase family protein n=1 Tax=uncultured Microbacterium sp. TaxID=191216 RepID=UPI0026213D5D|nr:cysteine desulfurase family protein [uncultured Microbacterium sp.]